MMTIIPTTTEACWPVYDRDKQPIKDQDQDANAEFMNLLAALCGAPVALAPQSLLEAPEQDTVTLITGTLPAFEPMAIPAPSLDLAAVNLTEPSAPKAKSEVVAEPPSSPTVLPSFDGELNLPAPVAPMTAASSVVEQVSEALSAPVVSPSPSPSPMPSTATSMESETRQPVGPAPETDAGVLTAHESIIGRLPLPMPRVKNEPANVELSEPPAVAGGFMHLPEPTAEPIKVNAPVPQVAEVIMPIDRFADQKEGLAKGGQAGPAFMPPAQIATTEPLLQNSLSRLKQGFKLPPDQPTPTPPQTQDTLAGRMNNFTLITTPMTRIARTPDSHDLNSNSFSTAALADSQLRPENVEGFATLQQHDTEEGADPAGGYFAAATRMTHEINPLLAIRRGFTANADLQSTTAKHESTGADEAFAQLIQTNPSSVAFAPELAVDAPADSPAAQSISHILALAETLSVRQIRSIRLHLKPEELGQVEVQLKRDADGKISAHLTAERETARQSLSQSLGQLRETLERAGLTVDRLQVRSETSSLRGNSNQDQSRSQYRKPQSENHRSITITATAERGRVGLRDHKLLSLSA